MPDRGEAPLSGAELAGDHVLDIGLQRGIRAQDQLAQSRCQLAVFAGELGELRPGDVEDADGVAGEVRGLDHPCPRAGRQAGQHVLAVLLVLVAAGFPSGVGDRGDQLDGADAELPGQHGQGGRPPAGRDAGGVVLDGVVQPRGAGHVRVADAVMGQDADRDPQQVAGVGFALPPAGGVQPGRQRQGVRGPAVVRRGEPGGLRQQPFP